MLRMQMPEPITPPSDPNEPLPGDDLPPPPVDEQPGDLPPEPAPLRM